MAKRDNDLLTLLRQIRDSLARLELQAAPATGSPSTRSLAAAIRAELERSGKTRTELATVLKRSRQNVAAKIAGDYPFRTDELTAAAAFLNCTVLELMQSALRQEAKTNMPVQDASAGFDRRINMYEQPPRAAAVTRRQAENRVAPTR